MNKKLKQIITQIGQKDRSYRILIIDGIGSGRTNVLLNLIKIQWSDIDKIYSCIKDPFESKYQLLINAAEKVGVKTLNNLEAFIDYSQTIKLIMNIIQLRKGEC